MHDEKRLRKRRNINFIDKLVEEVVEEAPELNEEVTEVSEEVVEEVKQDVFICKECGKEYKTERGLNNHIKTKHQEVCIMAGCGKKPKKKGKGKKPKKQY